MQRALNRAYQRLQGNHPRRPKSNFSWLAHLVEDTLLASAGLAVLGGAGLAVWALIDRFEVTKLVSGVAFIALGVALLYVWDKVVWQPFARSLSDLT